MDQVLLPRCYTLFTQLIRDSQFSALGLALVAELSSIRNLVTHCNDQTENNIDPARGVANSSDYFPVDLSEDIGEYVGRTIWRNSTNVKTHLQATYDIVTGSGQVRDVEMRHREMEAGPNSDAPANVETKFPQPKAGAPPAGLNSLGSSTPDERQKGETSLNTIDDLFQGLDQVLMC